jgi:hypothetical protein
VTAGSGGETRGAWTSVPGAAPCALEVADPPQIDIVPFVWTDCGPGCTTTAAKVLATDEYVFNRLASARNYPDGVHVRLATMRGSVYYLNAVRRLSDGALLAAVRAAGDTRKICGLIGFAPSAPHVIGFQKADSAQAGSLGTTVVAFLQSGTLGWAPPAPGLSTIQTSVVEYDIGWGLGLYDGTLRVMMPASSTPLAIVDRGSYPAYSAVGWGSLVISNPAPSGSPDEVIRAWDPQQPSRTIVAQADTGIPAIALSATTMAWVGVHGPGRRDGTYTAAELYFTPFPAGQDAAPIMGGTPIPAVNGLLELQTWNDHAAALGVLAGSTNFVLFVVRLSDGHLWTIKQRPGAVFMRVLALSPTEIVVGENDNNSDPALASQVQHLTRYQLARLDDLAAAW